MKHIAVTVMVAIVIMGHTQPSNLKHYYYTAKLRNFHLQD